MQKKIKSYQFSDEFKSPYSYCKIPVYNQKNSCVCSPGSDLAYVCSLLYLFLNKMQFLVIFASSSLCGLYCLANALHSLSKVSWEVNLGK